eukprot:TRINITY_DN12166_c1_g1_i4.p1 TRINITY_DN12166_c1_g1~~TRINITY_DN12166_c1_g1_i4.p1  ORF type:complete len:469 (+),score=23.97 TRINITY_DN12166_c1_g1_i4:188-1594(+)
MEPKERFSEIRALPGRLRSYFKEPKFHRRNQTSIPLPDQQTSLSSEDNQSQYHVSEVQGLSQQQLSLPTIGGSDQLQVQILGQRTVSQRQQSSGAPTNGKPSRSDSNFNPNDKNTYDNGKGMTSPRCMSATRIEKFMTLLNEDVINLDKLSEISWSGIPPSLRAQCWKLLLGYLPTKRDRWQPVLKRRMEEYQSFIPEYEQICVTHQQQQQQQNLHPSTRLTAGGAYVELGALRQVSIDVPRTAPEVELFSKEPVRKLLERLLYVWGMRHPASGYVQGMNNLATPFIYLFSEERCQQQGIQNVEQLGVEDWAHIETDCYWCLDQLLNGIQDNYTYAQPGIQRSTFKLEELLAKVDSPLAEHIKRQGLATIQFAFRWVNCLLIREIPFHLCFRLWDTLLSERARLTEFLVYISAAFLCSWSKQLLDMEFQEMLIFIQKPPTDKWSEADIEAVLAQAYVWRAHFGGSFKN